MISKRTFSTARPVVVLVLALVFSTAAWAVKETVLYSFPEDGSTGNYPESALVMDKAGNLYGTTDFGGVFGGSCVPAGCGTVFELSPPSEQGGTWTETVIYEFQGSSDGDRPQCTLVIDGNGNLYGTSIYGYMTQGPYGVVVWELSPPSQPGGEWVENNLYSFSGLFLEDYNNSGSLVMDSAGNLYGVSPYGGSTNCGTYGCGTVFEASPPSHSGGNWSGAILYAFLGGTDGSSPAGGLIFDSKGALYGTTQATAFQLVPPSQPGGAWTENVIYEFSGTEAGGSYGNLIFDRKGNLYGTIAAAGPLNCSGGRSGCGDVFELSPPSQGGGSWSETVLYNFMGQKNGDGQYPYAGLIRDGQGNLYGTTDGGGYRGEGTVFELIPPSQPGGSWTENQLSLGKAANGDAYYPVAGLMFGPGKAVAGTGTGEFSGGGVFLISQ